MMDEKTRTKRSKFLSFVLRHKPEVIGLQLDSSGWVAVEALLRQCQAHGERLSRSELEEIVSTNPKRRFALSDDGLRIRASQGHSTEVDLGYEAAVPPEFLFHGTVDSVLEAIRTGGLQKMQRHHVHLSADLETARIVGARRGKPVLLRVHSGKMHRDGHTFFLSANSVWLTDAVPAEYVEQTGGDGAGGR